MYHNMAYLTKSAPDVHLSLDQ